MAVAAGKQHWKTEAYKGRSNDQWIGDSAVAAAVGDDCRGSSQSRRKRYRESQEEGTKVDREQEEDYWEEKKEEEEDSRRFRC